MDNQNNDLKEQRIQITETLMIDKLLASGLSVAKVALLMDKDEAEVEDIVALSS